MSISRLMQMARAGVPSGGTGSEWTDPDLTNASYDSVSFSVATEDTAPRKVLFNSDGTKMYMAGSTYKNIYEYDLSTAWDITSATFLQSFSVSTEATDIRGLYFKPDGTEVYIIDSGLDNVTQYSLSTAWDISTASFLQSFSVASQETSPQGLFFKQDGTKMFVVGIIGDSVYEYDLSTAWDISTASYTQSFNVIAQKPFVTDVLFNPDGDKMWAIGQTSDSVSQYSLSTAWDISSASYDSVAFSVASQETSPQGFFFKPDGSKMYIVGTSTDTIYQYSTVTPAAPEWTDPDLANASYDSVSLDVSTADTQHRNIFFKPDGLSLFMVGDIDADINEYTLSSAWDITTASYTQNFSVSAQGVSPYGLFFKSDGTKMYTTDYGNDDAYEYSLSSAWDISTASFVQSLDISSFEAGPTGLFFKSDGTKMYHVGFSGDEVNEYTLSTAWDISSASHVQAFGVSAQDTGPSDVYFNPTGTKMWVCGTRSDSVYEYGLSSAWDVSTASYSSVSFSVASQETTPTCLLFKPDGSKMFVTGSVTNTLYQYSTA